MKHGFCCSALLISAALATLPATAGQLYKWTDANGRVQYSDTKPNNAKVEPVRAAVPTASSGSGSSSYAEKEQAFKKRKADANEQEQKVAKEEANKADDAENCRRAKSSLSSLEMGGRYYETDDKGDRKYYDQSRLDSEKDRVREFLSKNCDS